MKKTANSGQGLANPFTDSQFKLIFDEETTGAFLNSILKLESPITELTIQNCEDNDTSIFGSRVYFDVLCKDSRGREFIVEMQTAWKDYLRNRLVFYTCRRVNEMGRQYEDKRKKSKWKYKFQPVYTICLLDDIDKDTEKQVFRQDAVLYDTENCLVFSDKIRIITINLKMLDSSIFTETAEYYEKCLSLLCQISENMSTVEELIADIDAMPVSERDKEIFRRVVSVSDLSSMTEKQRIRYEEELMYYLDTQALIASAEDDLEEAKAKGLEEGRAKGLAEGKAQGRAEGILETAKAMKARGMSIKDICEITGLTEEKVRGI